MMTVTAPTCARVTLQSLTESIPGGKSWRLFVFHVLLLHLCAAVAHQHHTSKSEINTNMGCQTSI